MKKCLLFFVVLFFSEITIAQILNGTFEENGIPSMEHWVEMCASPELVQDAPPNGGEWSLKVWPGNAQGCFPGYVYQILPFINDQGPYPIQLEAWTKSAGSNLISINFAKMGLSGDITLLNGDTTSVGVWTKLVIQDTFTVNKEETALILVNTGLTGGPGDPSLFAFIDKFVISDITTATHKPTPLLLDVLSNSYPNPAGDYFRININKSANIKEGRLLIYNSLGQKMTNLAIKPEDKQLEIAIHSFAKGTYFYRLETVDGISDTKKLFKL